MYQTGIISCNKLLLKDISIAYRWFIFTAHVGLVGNEGRFRSSCVKQDALYFTGAVSNSCCPSFHAFWQSNTSEQQHKNTTTCLLRCNIDTLHTRAYLSSCTYSCSIGNVSYWRLIDTGKKYKWIEFCLSSKCPHGKK